MTRSLPPKVSAAGFDRALAGWRAIVGESQVVTSAAGLASYLDPFAPGEREAFSASAALLPASVDEIRAVLRIAKPRFPWSRTTATIISGLAVPTARKRTKQIS